jgi:WD40 repeat protein
VKLWDVDSGRELRTFAGHAGWVKAVALSADGKRALSGSEDGTVKLWDVQTGQVILTFTNDAPIWTCAPSATLPAVIIAGDRVGRVHFLRLIEPGDEQAS